MIYFMISKHRKKNYSILENTQQLSSNKKLTVHCSSGKGYFLDIEGMHCGNKLLTDMLRKPTDTHQNRISSNKRPRLLFKFEAKKCGWYWKVAPKREAFISK